VLERAGRTVGAGAAAVGRSRYGPHAVLFGIALALRVAWVLAVDRDGFALNDALIYHGIGESLSHGDGFMPPHGEPSAQWPPGYSVVLGALYSVFGVEPVVGELANAVLGAVTVVLLMLVVGRLVDRATAIVAGAMLAVLPGPILWTDVLVTETLFTLLFVLLFVVLAYGPGRDRAASWWWLVAVGLVIGAAANVRGEALTWGLLPVVYLWRRGDWRRFATQIASIAAVAALALVPWTVRNLQVMDAFVPTGTNASHTLWVGHNPSATGAQVYPPDGYFDQFTQTAPDRELQAAAALRREALDFMFSHPLRELELIPLKLIHLNRGDSYAFDWVNAVPPGEAPPVSAIGVERIGVLADAGYYGLLTLTVAGAVLLGRRFWRPPAMRCVAAAFATALFLYGFMYYGNYRYRLPFEPLMVVVAASLVTTVWRRRGVLMNNP